MTITLIQDPQVISQDQMPLLVFLDSSTIIGDIIDCRTHIPGLAPKCHAMLAINQGKFVSQGFITYAEFPMEDWMVQGNNLVFVQLVNSNPNFVQAFRDSVNARLASPWWTKIYDFPGIFGQAIGQNWIHTPGLEYCSVDVIRHLVNSCPKLPKADQLVINAIPPETNPEVLWQIIVSNPNIFKIYGTWTT